MSELAALPRLAAIVALGRTAHEQVLAVTGVRRGAALGTMFPTGLRLARERSPLFVPWAFGINGVFSVIGTAVVPTVVTPSPITDTTRLPDVKSATAS